MKWSNVKRSLKSPLVIDELNEPLSINLIREGITVSLLSKFLKCKRCFYLSLRGWESLEKKLTRANGTITHDILDNIYTFYQFHNELPNNLKLKQWVDEYDKKNPEWMSGFNSELMNKFKAVCMVVTSEYMRYFKNKGEFTNKKILGAENIFDLNYKDIRLRGKKDLRFKYKSSKYHYVMETKTMARIILKDLRSRLNFDPQCLMYTVAEEIEYKQKCVGVVYNIVRNPGHIIGLQETLNMFCKRLRKEIRKDPEHFFIRINIPFSIKDKMEFKNELIYKYKDLLSIINGKTYPYKNELSCVNPFPCEYLQACNTGKLIGYSRTKELFKELKT